MILDLHWEIKLSPQFNFLQMSNQISNSKSLNRKNSDYIILLTSQSSTFHLDFAKESKLSPQKKAIELIKASISVIYLFI